MVHSGHATRHLTNATMVSLKACAGRRQRHAAHGLVGGEARIVEEPLAENQAIPKSMTFAWPSWRRMFSPARDDTRLDFAPWSGYCESLRHTALPRKQISSHCAR
jgi:hypothetical protein